MHDYYEARASEYDEVYDGRGPASLSEPDGYRAEVRILREIIGSHLKGRLVDIACGTAFWLPAYAGRIRSVTLFDQSPGMLDAARSRAAESGISDRSSLVRGNAITSCFRKASFQCALVGFLLSHFTSEEERRFFVLLRSTLEPSGSFLILDSVWTSARAAVRQREGKQLRRLNDGRSYPIYKRYFDRRDLEAMEERHGMTTSIEHFGGAFFALRGTFASSPSS